MDRNSRQTYHSIKIKIIRIADDGSEDWSDDRSISITIIINGEGA